MKKLLACCAAASLILGLSAAAYAQTPAPAPAQPGASGSMTMQGHHMGKEHHPEIKRALHALENAKADLEHASHDFQGHRAKALEDVDAAIQELNQALAVDNK